HPRGGGVRGHLPGLDVVLARLVGRGRGEVLHRRRRRVPHHGRQRHGGLLRRGVGGCRVELRQRIPARPGVGTALPRPSPGAQGARPRGSGRSVGPVSVAMGSAQEVRVTVQALGWRRNQRYEPWTADIASVAYWYEREPPATFPALPAWRHRWGR